ncbi:PREDICTED: iroquois-class homeodomain protein IRX-4-like [Priapulus caudatus]|uniref:Iroquois-class homeodomain protein IRX-4-like n=1 Tax=Priapulus caudatus TaxID=37621 RepID=A0ABM1E662_PRICU|nr:PREDICTED: iroquois-class homeodomain protein IRX-4-like [Priapulus caudatus]
MTAYPPFGFTFPPTSQGYVQKLPQQSYAGARAPQRHPCSPGSQAMSADLLSSRAMCFNPAMLASYPRLPTVPVYSPEQGYVPVYAADPAAALYPPMNGSNDTAWRLGQPHLVSHPYELNGYYYDSNGIRRKNVTREASGALKAWMREHIKNPYPTKGEKIMLAVISRMTLTQVSTWFANARRRLKKDTKFMSKDAPTDEHSEDEEEEEEEVVGENQEISVDERREEEEEEEEDEEAVGENKDPASFIDIIGCGEEITHGDSNARLSNTTVTAYRSLNAPDHPEAQQKRSPVQTNSATKPKIWSLAETATSTSSATGPSVMHAAAYVSSPAMMASGICDFRSMAMMPNMPAAAFVAGYPRVGIMPLTSVMSRGSAEPLAVARTATWTPQSSAKGGCSSSLSAFSLASSSLSSSLSSSSLSSSLSLSGKATKNGDNFEKISVGPS